MKNYFSHLQNYLPICNFGLSFEATTHSGLCKPLKKYEKLFSHLQNYLPICNFGLSFEATTHSGLCKPLKKYEKLFSLPLLTIICNSKLFFFLNVPLDFFFPSAILSEVHKFPQSITVYSNLNKGGKIFNNLSFFFFMPFFEMKIKLKNEIKKEKEVKIQKFHVNEGKVQKISYGSSRPP